MQITLLGTGTSHGVPTIDCMLDSYAHCPHQVCRKANHDPRHRRTRASIIVCRSDTRILIDTSQDFRQQVLSHRVGRIDAVLYTHGHADHIYGLPDIRSYCRHQGGAIDIYGSPETLCILRRSFEYVFSPPPFVGGGIPKLNTHSVQTEMMIGAVRVVPVPVEHGSLEGCCGYRLDDVAYIPDAKLIPSASLAYLGDLDLLILNCLRIRPHASHLSLEESLDYVKKIRPRRCLLTHVTHDIDYQIEGKTLPEGVSFAYDGQTVDV